MRKPILDLYQYGSPFETWNHLITYVAYICNHLLPNLLISDLLPVQTSRPVSLRHRMVAGKFLGGATTYRRIPSPANGVMVNKSIRK